MPKRNTRMGKKTLLLTTTFALISLWLPQAQAQTSLARLNLADVEIPMAPGFPVEISPSGVETSSQTRGVVLADLDGDQDLEIVFARSTCLENDILCGEGLVLAWDHQGNVLSGFPVVIDGSPYASPSVGDLDGDGRQEIVLVTVEAFVGFRMYVIESDGLVRPSFPVFRDFATEYATLYDLDEDGFLEIVWATHDAVSVFESDGTEWLDGWPVLLPTGATIDFGRDPVSIGDVDGNGSAELVIATYDSMVHVIKTDGEEMDGWPAAISDAESTFNDIAVILADLDNNSDFEIIVAVRHVEEAAGSAWLEMNVLQADGQPLQGWPQRVDSDDDAGFSFFVSEPLVSDLEGDGNLDIVVAVGQNPHLGNSDARIIAWEADATIKDGFPYQPQPEHTTGAITLLTAADYDGDGNIEVFADATFGDRGTDGYYRGSIIGIDSTGSDLPGFPIVTNGSTRGNGAIIGDVDGDGDYEIAATGDVFRGRDNPESGQLELYLYDLPNLYKTSHFSWPTFHASNHRGGLQKGQYRGWRMVRGGTRYGAGR